MGRCSFFERNVSCFFLFGYGIIISLSVIFQHHLVIKLLQLCFFSGIVLLEGKRLQIVGVSIFFLITILTNVFVREGQVLFSVIGFPVTLESLRRGTERGLSLITLYYVSKSLLGAPIRMKGPWGRLVNRIFGYFYFLTAEIHTIRAKTVLRDLDRLLLRANSSFGKTDFHRFAKPIGLRGVYFYGSVLAGNLFFLILCSGVFGDGFR